MSSCGRPSRLSTRRSAGSCASTATSSSQGTTSALVDEIQEWIYNVVGQRHPEGTPGISPEPHERSLRAGVRPRRVGHRSGSAPTSRVSAWRIRSIIRFKRTQRASTCSRDANNDPDFRELEEGQLIYFSIDNENQNPYGMPLFRSCEFVAKILATMHNSLAQRLGAFRRSRPSRSSTRPRRKTAWTWRPGARPLQDELQYRDPGEAGGKISRLCPRHRQRRPTSRSRSSARTGRSSRSKRPPAMWWSRSWRNRAFRPGSFGMHWSTTERTGRHRGRGAPGRHRHPPGREDALIFTTSSGAPSAARPHLEKRRLAAGMGASQPPRRAETGPGALHERPGRHVLSPERGGCRINGDDGKTVSIGDEIAGPADTSSEKKALQSHHPAGKRRFTAPLPGLPSTRIEARLPGPPESRLVRTRRKVLTILELPPSNPPNRKTTCSTYTAEQRARIMKAMREYIGVYESRTPTPHPKVLTARAYSLGLMQAASMMGQGRPILDIVKNSEVYDKLCCRRVSLSSRTTQRRPSSTRYFPRWKARLSRAQIPGHVGARLEYLFGDARTPIGSASPAPR